jgi:hypothetical protein
MVMIVMMIMVCKAEQLHMGVCAAGSAPPPCLPFPCAPCGMNSPPTSAAIISSTSPCSIQQHGQQHKQSIVKGIYMRAEQQIYTGGQANLQAGRQGTFSSPPAVSASKIPRYASVCMSGQETPGFIAPSTALWAASTALYTSFCALVKVPLTGQLHVMSGHYGPEACVAGGGQTCGAGEDR